MASPLVNLPNKRYWTAPERVGGTVEFLRRQHLWLVVATMALVVVLSHLMLRSAATGRGPTNSQMLIVIGGYLAVVGLWAVRLIAHFRRVDV
jgi:membrane-bound acyltransferase YfiQ involved in biofilm formation